MFLDQFYPYNILILFNNIVCDAFVLILSYYVHFHVQFENSSFPINMSRKCRGLASGSLTAVAGSVIPIESQYNAPVDAQALDAIS
jgi:hypothetical protein